MKISAIPLTICVCVTLSACARLPPATQRAADMALPKMTQTLNNTVDRHFSAGEWPKTEWWKTLHNAQLNTIIATALQEQPNLKLVADRIHVAEALAEFRRADLLPTINAEAGIAGRHFSKNSIQSKLSDETFVQVILNPLSFRYQLDLWGRNRAALASTLGQVRARQAEVAQARMLLSTAIARSYFRLVGANLRLEALESLTQTLVQQVRLTELRWRIGIDATMPINTVKVRLQTIRQTILALQSDMQVLRHQLASLAGKGPDWGRTITIAASDIPKRFPLPNDIHLNLLAHRPDVSATREYAKAALQDIRVAKTAFYPDINLSGFAGLDSVNLPDLLLTPHSIAFAVGPALQLPLFQGGRLEANLKSSQANYDIAIETYNATVLRATQEVADALTRWQEIQTRLQAQEQAIAMAEENHRLAQINYRLGISQRMPLLETSFILTEQQLTLRQLETEQQLSLIQLTEALGGGYEYNPTHR